MQDRIVQALHQTSSSELIAAIEKAYSELIAAIKKDHTASSESANFASSMAATFAKLAKIPRLSDLDLLALSKSCVGWTPPSSHRIIVCGSKDQISDLQIGDTIMTPEGMWQILPDFQEQLILTKKELAALPSDLVPNDQTPLTVIKSNDEPVADGDDPAVQKHKLLTSAINKACAKKPNSLYLGEEFSPAAMRATDVMRILKRDHLDKEVAHRKLFDIIYKVSKVKTDIQFTQGASRIYKKFLELSAAKGIVTGADEYKTYLAAVFPDKINFSQLSDQELAILSYAGYQYEPARSERIFLAQSIADINDRVNFVPGDTFILPTGVYQLDKNEVMQSILTAGEMRSALPPGLIPTDTTELEKFEPSSEFIDVGTSYAVQLPLIINQAIQETSNAMPLGVAAADGAHISTAIVRAGSLVMLRKTGRLKHGPTFIVPEGIFQVDQENNLHCILSQEVMQQSIPAKMLPDTKSTPESLFCLDIPTVEKMNQNTLLTQSLLTAFEKKPNALYLGHPQGEAASRAVDITSTLHYLAEQELHRRRLKTNLILKAFNFRTDTEFMDYFVNRLYPGKMNAKELASHIDQVLHHQPSRINLAILTDVELRDLCQQCTTWSPKISSRILCCQTFPENARIGDTVILPDGVYQIRIDEGSGKIKQEKLINQTELSNLEISDFIPDAANSIRIIDDYSTEDAKELIAVLNPTISAHSGLYLHKLPGNDSESYGAVTTVLKQMAEQELAARALNRFKKPEERKSWFSFSGLGLFSSTRRVAPIDTSTHQEELDRPISSQSRAKPTQESKPNLKQLRTGANRLKQLQKELADPTELSRRLTPSSAVMFAQADSPPDAAPRSIQDVRASMDDIKKELNLVLSAEPKHSSEMSANTKTVQILQDTRVVMEASPNTVAMYKPLLQAKLKDQQKAELFLQALGIPPTQGKHKVEVRGGHHPLRVAIRQLFKEYKDQENLQQKLDPNDSGHETDTDLSSQGSNKR